MIPFESFWYTQGGGPIHCTAGWESETCQRLMGHEIRTGYWKSETYLNSKPIFLDWNMPAQASAYYAIV